MKIGSMFSGYGGLDLAVEAAFNASTSWHCEWEDAPSKVLAARWPGVPNYRDVTQVDWSSVPPVDIITGGFPCQDVSLAGRRAGMTEGTRSNLWGAMRTAIETIQPQYVVAENVRGLLSAKAASDSDMEPGPGSLGDDGRPNLRAIGRVLGDLADCGYDAQWRGLRAADVGAPHGRFRVFILATRRDVAEDTSGSGSRGWGTLTGAGQGGEQDTTAVGAGHRHGRSRPVQCRVEGQPAEGGQSEPTADASRIRPCHDIERGRQRVSPPVGSGRQGGLTANTVRRELQRRGGHGTVGSSASSGEGIVRERERLWDAAGDSGPEDRGINWGQYAPAIARWEQLHGRTPAPTELTAKGKHRLSARFAEWMMGLPAGWVTDIDISRNEQLKALGNGVVPQQCYAALTHMLNTHTMENAA